MTILIVFAVVTLFGVILLNRSYEWDGLGIALALLGGIGLAAGLMALPMSRMEWHSKIVEIQAIKESRELHGAPDIEAAAWRMQVAEVNAELASARYYNGTLFDIWIPDEVMAVEPIR